MRLIFHPHGEHVQDSGQAEPKQPWQTEQPRWKGEKQHVWDGDKGVSVLQRHVEIGRGQTNKSKLEATIEDALLFLKGGEILPRQVARQIRDTAEAQENPTDCITAFENMKKQFYAVLTSEHQTDDEKLSSEKSVARQTRNLANAAISTFHSDEAAKRDKVVHCNRVVAAKVEAQAIMDDFWTGSHSSSDLCTATNLYETEHSDADDYDALPPCAGYEHDWSGVWIVMQSDLGPHCKSLKSTLEHLETLRKEIESNVQNRKKHDQNFAIMECHFRHGNSSKQNISKPAIAADCENEPVQNENRFYIDTTMPDVTPCGSDEEDLLNRHPDLGEMLHSYWGSEPPHLVSLV